VEVYRLTQYYKDQKVDIRQTKRLTGVNERLTGVNEILTGVNDCVRYILRGFPSKL